MKHIIFFLMVFAVCQSGPQHKKETIDDQNRIDRNRNPEENKADQNLNASQPFVQPILHNPFSSPTFVAKYKSLWNTL